MFQKEKNEVWKVVVLGVLRQGNKVLLGQRPKSGFWEFPGGKIEKRETPQEALVRELKEELDLEVKVGNVSLVLSYFYEHQSILLVFYQVSSWEGDLKPLYHEALKWVDKESFCSLRTLEANREYLSEIIESLNL